MSKIPQELIKKPGRTPGLAGDILELLFGGDTIDPSDLIAPLGMAKIGRSGAKYIDKFLTHEGRVMDIDPENLGRITHSKYVREKLGQDLESFIRNGGVRGSEFGLEFAVDATGKPKPGKQTLDRSIQTLMRAYNERGLPFDEKVYLDLLQPSGHHKPVETTIEELLRSRGK